MTHRTPTYEEYAEATEFARVRYRFGVFVQAFAVILFLFILVYTVINIEEMKANPAEYAEEKLGVQCTYPVIYNYNPATLDLENLTLTQNGSIRNT